MADTRSEQTVAEYDAAIRDRLGLEPDEHPDGPLVDLRDIAILGGLAAGTPGMARQRTARGEARIPFPEPDPEEGMRWEDKPLWRVYVILDYFQETGNWPLGVAARKAQRHPRRHPRSPSAAPEDKITWTALQGIDAPLAESIKAYGLNDGARRSVEQWRFRLETRQPTAA